MFSDLINRPHDAVGRCAGLARTVCRRLDIELPPWGEIYSDQAEAEIEARKGLFREVTRPMPGDLVHVRSWDGGHHVGVVISRSEMIQSTRTRGVHTLRLDHPWLKGRIIGFYRYDRR